MNYSMICHKLLILISDVFHNCILNDRFRSEKYSRFLSNVWFVEGGKYTRKLVMVGPKQRPHRGYPSEMSEKTGCVTDTGRSTGVCLYINMSLHFQDLFCWTGASGTSDLSGPAPSGRCTDAGVSQPG